MGRPVIETHGITKRYGKLLAVDGVDLSVAPGSVFALMGRNGAGKTTLIRMLLGLTPITKGSANVLGMNPARRAVPIRRKVGYVPEEHHMYPWMRVGEVAWFTSAFYPTWDAALCARLLDRFGLDPQKRIRELSRGMKAKVALTLALAHRPPLLVLDEPTTGLDAIVRKEFLESLVEVAAEEGRTVFISSHLLTDVERIAERVALLEEGRLRLVEDVETLKARIHELRITFRDAPPPALDLPGVLSVQKTRREWTAVCEGPAEKAAAAVRAKCPGTTVAARALSLEEIFVALVGPSPEEAVHAP